MLYKKTWWSKNTKIVGFSNTPKYEYEGWFLLGFIPVFVIRHQNWS